MRHEAIEIVCAHILQGRMGVLGASALIFNLIILSDLRLVLWVIVIVLCFTIK